MQNYEEIFSKRGASYHTAMELCPNARDQEFESILDYLKKEKGTTILDIPAGGGYIQSFLPPEIQYLAYDFSGEFNHGHHGIGTCKESEIDLPSESVHEIISLASLHHIVDRYGFYREMHRILKKGGLFIIGDVTKGSKSDPFLNGFLDRWNSMGHDGKFIVPESDRQELEASGFTTGFEIKKFHWNFKNEAESLEFFRKLFFLNLNPPDELLKEEIGKLGITGKEGRFSVAWSLGFLKAYKH